jgi:hypothetical protein
MQKLAELDEQKIPASASSRMRRRRDSRPKIKIPARFAEARVRFQILVRCPDFFEFENSVDVGF